LSTALRAGLTEVALHARLGKFFGLVAGPRLYKGAAQPRNAGDRRRGRSHVRGGGAARGRPAQQEFARVTGASLSTVRKWERGERSPSGAARMLVRDPALVIAEAALAEGARKRKSAEAG
jgi:transcriptional regulator with XRE-family HTH domain